MIKNIIKTFIFIVVSLTLMRIGWFFKSMPQGFSNLDISNVLYAFFVGLRFDLATAAYGVIIPLLLLPLVVLFFSTKRHMVFSILLYIFTMVVVLINSFDLGFYNFFNDHINVIFFGLFEDDTVAVLKTIWKNYNVPLLSLVIGLAFYIHYRVFKKLISEKRNKRIKANILRSVASYLGLFLILLLVGRGRIGSKPLSYQDAEFSNDTFINQIGTNGIFSLYRATKLRSKFKSKDFDLVKEMGFKNKETQAFKHVYLKDVKSIDEGLLLLKKKTPKNDFLESNPPNVIVIMVESFGSYWLKYQSQKFNLLGDLKEHLDSGLSFENFTSPDNGTIGSLVSLMTGQIKQPGAIVLSEGRRSQKQIKSSIHLPYKEKGYKTLFGYGGKLGWRNIGKYAKIQGYEEIFGQNIISSATKTDDLGNEWGVYDEHLYNAMFDKILTSNRPVFMLSMTTSNHPPYDIPKNYKSYPLEFSKEMKSRFVKDEEYSLKRFKAFQYSNNMLAKFISKVKKSEIGDNTFIVFTGDHNFWDIFRFNTDENYSKRKVPLYIHIPSRYKKLDYSNYTKKFSTTIDIMPTLYPLTLSNTDFVSFGQNLFSDAKTYSMNSANLIANESGLFNQGKFYVWSNDAGALTREANEVETRAQVLDPVYRSMISIHELFLRNELKTK